MLFSFVFGLVDVNTADVKELSSLKGIGKTKAESIIKYRETKCFKTIQELTHVKGIGQKIFEQNKDNLTLSKCKQ